MRTDYLGIVSYLIALAIVYPLMLWLKHLGVFRAPIELFYWLFG